jgi:DNA mismatch repair protein MutS
VPNDARWTARRKLRSSPGRTWRARARYIRQVALLALLAQTGSFIPAAEARIDLVDRIFTRIGASDDLARGQSTFMVEMCETANILNNATPRSLIILDEIGARHEHVRRAEPGVEHRRALAQPGGAKTLFATHYHELTELAARLPRLKNFNVAVREWHDQIVFLRKIVEGGDGQELRHPGGAAGGRAEGVLERAKEILGNLEESELTPEGKVRQARAAAAGPRQAEELAPPPQMDLFG